MFAANKWACGAVLLAAGTAVSASPISAAAFDRRSAEAAAPSMFNLRSKDAPKGVQCIQVDVPPMGIRMLWSPCGDTDPRGPEAVFSLSPPSGSSGTVQIQEMHFTSLEPGLSPQCLAVNMAWEPNFTDQVVLEDCKDGAPNQQWNYSEDAAGNPQITSAYGSTKGQCLVQMQTPGITQANARDYYPAFGFLDCGSKQNTDKAAITPPSRQWVLNAVPKGSKIQPLFDLEESKTLDKDEETVPKGAFKLLIQGAESSGRCMDIDANDGSSIGTAPCISRFADNPLGIWVLEKTKNGNVQFRELHGGETPGSCLTNLDKPIKEGGVSIAGAGVQLFRCDPNAVYQQWRFDEASGKIQLADPAHKNECLMWHPEGKPYEWRFVLVPCDKANKFSKYTEYMHLDFYSEE